MKCARCQARNLVGAVSCWACGVRLRQPGRQTAPAAFRPEAMRYYNASAAAPHRAWMDALVLISTICFGVLLGYFVLTVLPTAGDATARRPRPLSALPNPLSFFSPAPKLLPAARVGTSVESRGIVAQTVDPRRDRAEGGRQASPGQEYLTVTAVIDNQGNTPLAYSLQDWQLRDSRGRVRSAEQIRGAGWLSGGTVDPGQRVQAQVTFLIPAGEASPQVTFSPRDLHAVMRWDASPPPIG